VSLTSVCNYCGHTWCGEGSLCEKCGGDKLPRYRPEVLFVTEQERDDIKKTMEPVATLTLCPRPCRVCGAIVQSPATGPNPLCQRCGTDVEWEAPEGTARSDLLEARNKFAIAVLAGEHDELVKEHS
jgi:hypothetical protein